MERLFYHFCWGCIYTLIVFVVSFIAAHYIIGYQMDCLKEIDIATIVNLAILATPTMLLGGSISVVGNHKSTTKKEKNPHD